jgi:glycosyltransferase involved in cell wall biosynthesis
MIPKVSIIIPAYKTRFFEKCLRSAILQSYSNIEILIGDDSATDEIKDIVDRLVKQSRFSVFYKKNAKNLGESPNFEQCILSASGDYIKPLYDDDFIHRDCVLELVKLMQAIPNAVLAACQRDIIEENDYVQPRQLYNKPLAEKVFAMDGLELMKYILSHGINFIGEPSCVMFKKSDALQLLPNMFQINGRVMYGCADMVLYSKLLPKGKFVFNPKAYCFFRHLQNDHENIKDTKPESPNSMEYLKEYFENLWSYKSGPYNFE